MALWRRVQLVGTCPRFKSWFLNLRVSLDKLLGLSDLTCKVVMLTVLSIWQGGGECVKVVNGSENKFYNILNTVPDT